MRHRFACAFSSGHRRSVLWAIARLSFCAALVACSSAISPHGGGDGSGNTAGDTDAGGDDGGGGAIVSAVTGSQTDHASWSIDATPAPPDPNLPDGCVNVVPCKDGLTWDDDLCACVPDAHDAGCIRKVTCKAGVRWDEGLCRCVAADAGTSAGDAAGG